MKLFDVALARLIEEGKLTLEFKDFTPEQFARLLQQGAYQSLYEISLVVRAPEGSDADRLEKIDQILRDSF
jgi:hypothetical protein